MIANAPVVILMATTIQWFGQRCGLVRFLFISFRIWSQKISMKNRWAIPQECFTLFTDAIDPFRAKTKSHITVKDVLKFFVQYMKNDQLGMIANAHLGEFWVQWCPNIKQMRTITPTVWKILAALVALIDFILLILTALAQLHSMAVDFPKTGESNEFLVYSLIYLGP